MFAHACSLSLGLALLLRGTNALSLDTGNTDSIKSAAKTLASTVVDAYKKQPEGSAVGFWREVYSWQDSGVIWGGLVEYSFLTGDSQFDDVIVKGLWSQRGADEHVNFMTKNMSRYITNSAQSTWALAALTAEEVGLSKPEKGAWIDFAKNTFDDMVQRWKDDGSCGGGLRYGVFNFTDGYIYKHTASTGNFFLLSARLARITGNNTYAEWADESFTWMESAGLISDTYRIFDGKDAETCDEPDHLQLLNTYSPIVEGAAVMYNFTNGNDRWKAAVKAFVSHLPTFQANNTMILAEVCEQLTMGCGTEYAIHKGLASRALARAAVYAPFAAEAPRKVLEASAKGAAQNCNVDGSTLACKDLWYEKGSEPGFQQGNGTVSVSDNFNALEVIQALLYQSKGVSTQAATSNSTNPPPTGTGSPAPTGAAGNVKVAWSGVVLAGLFAVLV